MTALEGWLATASRCLSPESAAQVRTEIQAHYESAREAAIAGGSAPDAAERAALAALGDARAANRQYRKVLLTAAEARMLRDVQWESRLVCSRPGLPWMLRLAPLILLGAAWAASSAGYGLAARVSFLLGMGSGILIAIPTLQIYTPFRSRLYRLLKWPILAAALALAFGPKAVDWWGALLICTSGVAWIEWTRHSIRRKLPVEKWPRALYL
jgi:hypothetical protein